MFNPILNFEFGKTRGLVFYITNLHSGEIYGTAIELLFSHSTPPFAVDYYKVFVNGVFHHNITASGEWVSLLLPSTSYDIQIVLVDINSNEYISNIINETTTDNLYAETYDSSYESMLDYAIANNISIPNSAQRILDNQRILNLKTESVWDELDTLWYFKASYPPILTSDNFYRINWKNPSLFRLNGTNTPVFITNQGFKALTGKSQYFKTDFIPLINAVKCIANNKSIIFHPFDIPNVYTNNSSIIGGRIGGSTDNRQINIARSSSTLILTRIYNFGPNQTISSSDQNTHWHFSVNGTSGNRYSNGSLVTSLTEPISGGLTQVQLSIFGFNLNGVFSGSPVDSGLRYIALGSELSAKQLEIYEILNDLY